MAYEINNLSPKSLKKIYLVLDDIKFNMEIQNKTKYLEMGQGAGVEGILENEYETIMTTLLNYTGFVDDVHREGSRYALDINVKKFEAFYCAVAKRINMLQQKNKVKSKSSGEDLSLDFNSQKSILYFRNFEIKMSLKKDKSNAHYVLEHIFTSEDDYDDNLGREFDYADIASETFKDDYRSKKNAWRKYHRACEDIQEKVRKASGVDDFLDFKSGKTGWVKINKKYLE